MPFPIDGFESRVPMPESKDFYDECYEGEYRTKVVGYEVARQDALRHFIPVVCGIRNPQKVLDYGAGNGLYVKLWEEIFSKSELSFCEISPVALEKLKANYPQYAAHCYLMSGDHVGLPDDSFDVVVSIEVMEHVEDLSAYTGEILRLLKPGGKFIWTTPCANPFSIEHIYNLLTGQIEKLPDGYRRWKSEAPAHLRRLKSGEAKKVLLDNGFGEVDFRFRSHLFSFICSRFPRRLKVLGEKLMLLDYRWFRRCPNGASILGCAVKRK